MPRTGPRRRQCGRTYRLSLFHYTILHSFFSFLSVELRSILQASRRDVPVETPCNPMKLSDLIIIVFYLLYLFIFFSLLQGGSDCYLKLFICVQIVYHKILNNIILEYYCPPLKILYIAYQSSYLKDLLNVNLHLNGK